MKFIKQLRFAALSVVCMSALAACISDPVGECPPDDDFKATRLAIRLPGIQNGMKTRADASDFDAINDLNVFIASGDNILHDLYIDVDAFNTPLETLDDAEVTFERDALGGTLFYEGAFLKGNGVSPDFAKFIVVANWGSEINEDSVEALRKYKDAGMSGAPGIPNDDKPIMFGESEVNSDASKTVQLKRTAAMITVEINGEQLNGDIEITPLSIRLHNVPTYALIGENNIMTEADGIEAKAGAIAPRGDEFNTQAWPSITNANRRSGGHFNGTNYSSSNVNPLFMYENYHGAGFGASVDDSNDRNQYQKRPAAAEGYSENEINAVAGACSYLEITANYANNTEQGVVTYRVFLGGDPWENFDVLRNYYYRVTLNLRNTGIGEGNSSWRLDANLAGGGGSDLTESDFTFNNNGEYAVTLEVTVTNQKDSQFNVEYDSNRWNRAAGRPFVYFQPVASNGSWADWRPMPATGGEIGVVGKDRPNGNRQFRFYVEPMIPHPNGTTGGTWNMADGVKRDVTFRFVQTTGSDRITTEWITITQYAPIPIPLSDYAGNDDIEAKVNELGWAMSQTLYLDRIDSRELPWGFDGVSITENRVTSSGSQNGESLMQYYAGGDNGASSYLSSGLSNGGSAMMDAAFAKFYQRNDVGNTGTGLGAMSVTPGTNQAINPTIANIQGYSTPNNYPDNYFIPSVAEWELLDMLHAANPNLFEGEDYQVSLTNRYWTSSADPGTTNSYVYRMLGQETADGRSETRNRTTPTVYRKMWVR